MSQTSKNFLKRLKKLAGIKSKISNSQMLYEQDGGGYYNNDWMDGSWGTWWNLTYIEGGVPYDFNGTQGAAQNGCYPVSDSPSIGISGNQFLGPLGGSPENCENYPGQSCCAYKTFCTWCEDANDVINFALTNGINDFSLIIFEVPGTEMEDESTLCVSPNGNRYLYLNAVSLCASAGQQGIPGSICAQPWYYMGIPIAWGDDLNAIQNNEIQLSDMGSGELSSVFWNTSDMIAVFNAVAADMAQNGNYDALQWMNSAAPLDTMADLINASGNGQTGFVQAGDGEVCVAGWGGGGGCAGYCQCACEAEQTNTPIVGCMDEAACNYNPNANVPCSRVYNNTTLNDGSTFMDYYDPPEPAGCLFIGNDWEDQLYVFPAGNPILLESEPQQALQEGRYKGTNVSGTNTSTSPGANCCCEYACYGCMEESADNYLEPVRDGIEITMAADPELVCLEGYGCTDPNALNYDETAEIDDGSCTYNFGIEGCSTFDTYFSDIGVGGGSIYYGGPNLELIFGIGQDFDGTDYNPDNQPFISEYGPEFVCQVLFYGNPSQTQGLVFNPYNWLGGNDNIETDLDLEGGSWSPPPGSNCVYLDDGTAELQVNGQPAVGLDIYMSQNQVQAAEWWNNACNCCEGFTPLAGCTEIGAINYDETAIINDGSCEYIYGCMDSTPGPYPNINGESSVIQGVTNGGVTYYMSCEGMSNMAQNNYNWETDYTEYAPCIVDSYDYDNYFDASLNQNFDEVGPHGFLAANYNPDAQIDDGSCFYDSDSDGVEDEDEILGCTDSDANNYNEEATQEDGSCEYSCSDIMENMFASLLLDPFTPVINTFLDDGSTIDAAMWQWGGANPTGLTFCEACSDCSSQQCWDWGDASGLFPQNSSIAPQPGEEMCNYGFEGYINLPSIEATINCCPGGPGLEVPGCTDVEAENYNPEANVDDGSCEYLAGCTEPAANNYDPDAIVDDGSCTYTGGCTDETALNYDPDAVINDGSCEYEGFICPPDDSLAADGCVSVSGEPGTMFPLEVDPDGNTISETLIYATEDECNDAENCVRKEKGEKILCWKCTDKYPYQPTIITVIAESSPLFEQDKKGRMTRKKKPTTTTDKEKVGCPGKEGYQIAPEPFWTWEGGPYDTTQGGPNNPCSGPERPDPESDPILGCTDSTAMNYDPLATEDDGSCEYVNVGGPWFCPADSGNFPWPTCCVQTGIVYYNAMNPALGGAFEEFYNAYSGYPQIQFGPGTGGINGVNYFTNPIGSTYNNSETCNANSSCGENMNPNGTGNCAGFLSDDPNAPPPIDESLVKRFKKLAGIKKSKK